MSNSFEDAMHQGFSRADMAQEVEEMEKRIEELGCHLCKYSKRSIRTCETIIEDVEGIYPRCPYFKKEEES